MTVNELNQSSIEDVNGAGSTTVGALLSCAAGGKVGADAGAVFGPQGAVAGAVVGCLIATTLYLN